MTASSLARAPRQSAILAAVAAIHVGAVLVIASGLDFRPLKLPVPTGPIFWPLPPPPKPLPHQEPEAPGPGEFDLEKVAMPKEPIPQFPDDPANDFPQHGPGHAVEPAGSGPRVGELQPPTISLRGDRLAALINGCYPSVARRHGDEGRARVNVAVDAEGRVASWALAEGTGSSRLDPGLDCVVRRLKFEPGRRDGRAVAAEVQLPIVFRLN